jgi:hypothetical protein
MLRVHFVLERKITISLVPGSIIGGPVLDRSVASTSGYIYMVPGWPNLIKWLSCNKFCFILKVLGCLDYPPEEEDTPIKRPMGVISHSCGFDAIVLWFWCYSLVVSGTNSTGFEDECLMVLELKVSTLVSGAKVMLKPITIAAVIQMKITDECLNKSSV